MAKFTPAPVTNILGNPTSAASTINANLEEISEVLEDTLSRTGVVPNEMETELDLNHQRIINVGEPVDPTDAVRLAEIAAIPAAVEAAEDAAARAEQAAENAETSEGNAAASASAAQTSANNAATSEANAATSESNAATSESNAAASALAAQTAESNAEAAASNAEAAQTGAEVAQAAAEAAQSGAESAKDDAEIAASTATTQAGIATTQAGIATTQAGNAATSAGNAQTAESGAVAAQSAAEDARDQAIAAAASVDLPIIQPGDAGKVLTVKATEDGYELDEAGSGSVESVVAGTGISVDNTDPANPVISSTGGGGGGQVDTVVAGDGISVDATDPANPEVSLDSAAQASLALADTAVQPGDLGDLASIDLPGSANGYVLDDSGDWVPMSTGGGNYTVPFTGGVSRAIGAGFGDLFNVRDYGAAGDGVTDDTAAIQAAVTAAQNAPGGNGKGIFLPRGRYLVTAPIDVAATNFTVRGHGKMSARILTPNDIDVFRYDISVLRHLSEWDDFAVEYTGGSLPTDGSCIRFWDSTGLEQGGGTIHEFRNLTLRNHANGIVFDRAKLNDWGGVNQIADYGHMMFYNIKTTSDGGQMKYAILFKGGPGAHNVFCGGSLSAQIACIQMGAGGPNDGVGDQVFVGVHLLNANYGINIIGPSDLSRYRENITFVACHPDGISQATYRLRRMQNFRILGGNSTSGAGFDLNHCNNYSVDETGQVESRYFLRPKTTTGGSTSLNICDFAVGSPALTTPFSAWVEIMANVTDNSGVRPVYWRGFLRCTNPAGPTWIVTPELSFNGGVSGAPTLTLASGGAGVRATLTFGSVPSGLVVDGMVRILGKNCQYIPL